MPAINTALSGVCYKAWNGTTNLGQINDVGNHTLKLILDGAEFIPSNAPTEVDSVNCPGLYKIDLTAAEMNAKVIVLGGVSSTPNVSIITMEIYTDAP